MTQSSPATATVKGPNGSLNVVLGEAAPEQILPWCGIVTAAFAPSFPGSAFLAQEEYLAQHPLTLNQGTRFWCIYLADDPTTLLAVTKTVRRQFLVRDGESVREETGYCIGYVGTHPDYRRLGLASLLIKHVAEWLDGPADAKASMLYTSVGDFYVGQGWDKISSMISNITHPSGDFQPVDREGLPSTRLLTDEEIPALCERDVADLKTSFDNLTVGSDEVHVAVIPSAEMVSWLHIWGDFLNDKLRGGEGPYPHGAICESANTWIYWHYGFKHLAIDRVVGKGSPEALAALLLDVLDEARKWNFPKVVAWEPTPELIKAMDIISKRAGVEVETVERPNSITSLRWKNADKTKKTTLHLNETYASC